MTVKRYSVTVSALTGEPLMRTVEWFTTDDLNAAQSIQRAVIIQCGSLANGLRVQLWDNHENRRIA